MVDIFLPRQRTALTHAAHALRGNTRLPAPYIALPPRFTHLAPPPRSPFSPAAFSSGYAFYQQRRYRQPTAPVFCYFFRTTYLPWFIVRFCGFLVGTTPRFPRRPFLFITFRARPLFSYPMAA